MKQKLICLTAFLNICLVAFDQKKIQTPVAGDSPKASVINEVTNNAKKEFDGKTFTPFGSSGLSNVLSNISLSSALKEGENGKIELKYTSKNWLTLGLSADQKIGKNDKEATPFDILDGISPGTTIKFNLQKMFWNPLLTEENFKSFDDAANLYAKRTDTDRRGVTYNDILHGDQASEISKLQQIKLKKPMFFNLEASLIKNEFKFATDSFSLATNEVTHLTPSLSAFFGIPFSSAFISIGYTYTETYEAADELTFTSGFGTSDNSYSRTLSFGAPTKKTNSKINFEWRKSFSGKKTISFGTGSTITYGFSSKKLALAIPLYFINSKDDNGKPMGLQGGIRFGYSTSTKKGEGSGFRDGFAAQLIVTAPFNIFENLKN